MASNQSPPIHKRIWVTSSETIVCETRAVEILKRYLKKDSELTSILHPIQRESYTYHYVSGTRRCTEKLQRSIEDSVAHRILAGTIDDIVAGISEDLQSKHKIIKLCYVSACLCSTGTGHWFVLPQIM